MTWTRDKILRTLRRLHKSGADLSYNAMTKRKQALLSACAYHFGTYPRAVERAGIDYAACSRRPRWTKAAIVAQIRKARRRGDNLHWSAMVKRGDELGRAAFASLQPRLFGTWTRALHAAGLDARNVSRYRAWNADSIAAELRAMRTSGRALNSGEVQTQKPALHAAALRHFASFDAALRAAHIDPTSVRQRRSWDRPTVARALRAVARRHGKLSDADVRRIDPALFGAAVRVFGSLSRARASAGV